jgi:integrase
VPRTPTFRVKNTPRGWLLHLPASISDTGKLQRRYFKTRDAALAEASTFRADYKAHGEKATALPPRTADQALAAIRLLEGTGANLVDAARAFRKSWDSKRSSQLFGKAVTTYLASRADLRKNTLDSYSYTLESVAQPLTDRMLSELKTTDFEQLLENKGPTSTRMHRANLRAFWRWASKAPREWCDVKVLESLEVARTSNDADIRILTPDDVEALLRAAEAEGPATAASYAIAIFGGVRMAELARLTWGDVGGDHIEIGKSISKKHSRRLVPVCATLKAWLDAYRCIVDPEIPITPPSWAEVSKSARRRAGWDVAARMLKKPPKPTRGPWPANACRHTCASVQVSIGTPLESLIFAFGHSGGHDMLRKHYVSRLTRKDALKILSLRPLNTPPKQTKTP